MPEVCSKCGLPLDLCICKQLEKEVQKIKIRTIMRRFKKKITIVEGLENDSNVEELEKLLKRKLACGGTYKNGVIELQGDHKQKVKEVLLKEGYEEGQIDAN